MYFTENLLEALNGENSDLFSSLSANNDHKFQFHFVPLSGLNETFSQSFTNRQCVHNCRMSVSPSFSKSIMKSNFETCIADKAAHPNDRYLFKIDGIDCVLVSASKFNWNGYIEMPLNHPDRYLNVEQLSTYYCCPIDLNEDLLMGFSTTGPNNYCLTREMFLRKSEEDLPYRSFDCVKSQITLMAKTCRRRSVFCRQAKSTLILSMFDQLSLSSQQPHHQKPQMNYGNLPVFNNKTPQMNYGNCPVFNKTPQMNYGNCPVFNKTPQMNYGNCPVLNKMHPVLNKMPPVFNKMPAVLNKMPPVLNKMHPVFNKMTPVFNKMPPVFNKMPVMDHGNWSPSNTHLFSSPPFNTPLKKTSDCLKPHKLPSYVSERSAVTAANASLENPSEHQENGINMWFKYMGFPESKYGADKKLVPSDAPLDDTEKFSNQYEMKFDIHECQKNLATNKNEENSSECPENIYINYLAENFSAGKLVPSEAPLDDTELSSNQYGMESFNNECQKNSGTNENEDLSTEHLSTEEFAQGVFVLLTDDLLDEIGQKIEVTLREKGFAVDNIIFDLLDFIIDNLSGAILPKEEIVDQIIKTSAYIATQFKACSKISCKDYRQMLDVLEDCFREVGNSLFTTECQHHKTDINREKIQEPFTLEVDSDDIYLS